MTCCTIICCQYAERRGPRLIVMANPPLRPAADHSVRRDFEQAMHLLHSDDPGAAAEVCKKALDVAPDNVDLLTLQGVSLLECRRPREALEPLQRAVGLAPRFARARENLGQALLQTGRLDEAVEQLQSAAELDPASASARMKLGHALAALGSGEEADTIFEEAFRLAPERGRLAEAGEHLREGRTRECERICRELLSRQPDEVNALRLLAKVAGETERWGKAEALLRRVLALAPGFHEARLDLARVYKQQDRIEDAVSCAAEAADLSPRNSNAHYVHASMLAIAGRSAEALEAYRQALNVNSRHTAAWVGMGHLLKTLGQQEEGIAAYRKAIEQRPNFAEVYWSLANLKTFRFTPEEVTEMQRRLNEEELDEDARVHFLFTLGKAMEDRKEYARAFEYYAEACNMQRMRISYDPVDTEVVNERIRAAFTASFIAEQEGQGCPDPAPIFIVGLPRSGSTLIEQILASHSQAEGTAELPDVGRVIGSLPARCEGEKYPEGLRLLDATDWRELGESYLELTRRHRRGLPYFTDKMPNNFPSIGLIHLMLPNAKIIDARRHPLDSCFGSFKQHFAHGQTFSYDLLELGEYFLEYRRMMRHWNEVLPGRVLEIRYEDMVRDQEGQTRRLLEYCGLPWEDACLRFYETERAVRTASSEQVRQPIYSSSVNHWRHFREELAPLIEVLGDELEGWDP
jgi:tetratricopeptide (TPR) repeat protein